MAHLTAEDARAFQTHGVTFNSFASTARGAQSLAAWRADFEPHTPGQAHTMNQEEVLYVTSGALDIEIDDQSFTAQAGDAVIVPAGAVLRVTNGAAEPASAWVTTLIGMTAAMQPGGEQVAPPWAQ
jgi:quercetin dioxygenase-like cupin family protein